MEDTLTDCMVRVKEDPSQLKKVRDYLRTKTEAEEGCSFTWRTIEAFNSILSVCSSQNKPETNALDILLDSFYYLARNNTDSSAWDNFGFELGIICVKVLSAIERTDIFEVLFSKLLSVITVMSEHNSGIWKAAARQILNVLINKKFSLHYLEEILKSYIFIIRNIESTVLYDFSSQNVGLLKTLSLLVQRVGDYEIQFDIVDMIFLHLSNDTKLMSGFFTTTENKFFHSLQFSDFEGDCRTFLNALNRQRGEAERRVYSICCHALYLGGCLVEPPMGRSCIWVDANKDTERVSIKCGDVASNANRVIFIRFSEVINVHIYNDNSEGIRRVIIQTKSLKGMHKDLRNDDICLVAENAGTTLDFVNLLEAVISERKRKRHGAKASKTVDCLFIDIRSSREVQDNAITSSNRSGVDHILSNAFFLPEKVNRSTANTEMENKSAQHLKVNSNQARTPPQRALTGKKTFFGSRELSPNSFAESLRKRLGLDSPEPKHTFEDSTQTVEFLQKDPRERSHKLFRSPDKIFNTFDANEPENYILDEDRENKPPVAVVKQSINGGKSQIIPTGSNTSMLLASRGARSYGSQKKGEAKLSHTQSQDYFRGSSNFIIKKKPSLPKLKRSKKATNKQFTKEENKSSPSLKDKYFSQNNAATEQIGDLNKTQSKITKLEQQRKFKGKTEMEGKPSRQGEKTARPEESRTSSDTGKERQTQAEKTKVFQKETDRRRSEPGRQKKQSGGGPLMPQVKVDSDVGGEATLKTEARENARPSLLDPNGYAYKRWCEPTTSERSNFWLKKLNALQKPNTDSNVFEFSEDQNSVVGKSIIKRKSVHSRRSRGMGSSKRMSLREAKEFLKKTPPLSLEKEKSREIYSPQMRSPEPVGSPESVPRTEESGTHRSRSSVNSSHSHRTSEGSSPEGLGQKNAVDEHSKDESASDEDDDLMLRRKKRERSDEDGSAVRTYIQKKPKTAKLFSSKVFLSILRRRLQRAEERDREQTDKIMWTVRESFDLLVERLQIKDSQRTRACLEKTEAAAVEAQAEIEDLSVLEQRTRRTVLYFRAGCSVSDLCRALDEQFSMARGSLQGWRVQKSASETVGRVGDRLSGLIKSEMQISIKSEWTWQRDLLFKCASFED